MIIVLQNSIIIYRPTYSPSLETPSPTPNPGIPVANVATNGTATSIGCTEDPENPPQLAIDGTTASYSCNGGSTFNKKGKIIALAAERGFEVKTDKLSIVTKLRVYANSNCKGCDPINYKIVGVSPDESRYLRRLDEIVISTGTLPWVGLEDVPRNPPDATIVSTFESGDDSLSYTEVTFDNEAAFDDYIVTFADVREDGNALVVGEVELVGVVYEPTNAPTAGPTRKPSGKPTGELL